MARTRLLRSASITGRRHWYQLDYHGQFLGMVDVQDAVYRFQPRLRDYPELAPLVDRTFASEAAIHTALDTFYSPEMRRRFDTDHAERTRRTLAERELIRAMAAEATFTGDRYDPERSLREVARLLLVDLKQAMADGALPADTYRVTARVERWTATPTLTIWTQHGATHDDVLRGMANRYNEVVGLYLSLHEPAHRSAFDITIDMNKAQYARWLDDHPDEKASWEAWQATHRSR